MANSFLLWKNLGYVNFENEMKNGSIENDEGLACQPVDQFQLQRERYRVFVEDVADGFYETDLKGNFIFFNDSLCRIFGYSRDEIQDKSYRNFMDEENARLAYESSNTLYRDETSSVSLTWEIIRKDGRRRTLEISAKLIYDDNGRKTGYRGIARDITPRIRAQKKIVESEKAIKQLYKQSRQAEERYRSFIRTLPDPVFVFNLDNTVYYLNPAFEKVFGWTTKEMRGKRIPFVPDNEREKSRQGIKKMFADGYLQGFETQRYTKDGRLLDIIVDAAIYKDTEGQPVAQVMILRDITQENRLARVSESLFKISEALHHYQGLDSLLMFITNQIKVLLNAERAQVILLDEKRKEFYFRASSFEEIDATNPYKEARIPMDSGVCGEVLRTRKPMIVLDYQNSPHKSKAMDKYINYKTYNILQVPLWVETQMIGVLSTSNKKAGVFDQADMDLLTTIAGIVALPIENARINRELQNSYDEVKSLNRAKDRIIDHLSHELKTPASVLAASLQLLGMKCSDTDAPGVDRIIDRCRRNLDRILDMQYELADITRRPDERPKEMLSALLDACSDELESLVSTESGESAAERIREKIDAVFGTSAAEPKEILPGPAVERIIRGIRPAFAHRDIQLTTRISETDGIWIPPEVFEKIISGLVQNAVEYTPEGGLVTVTIRQTSEGPALIVEDTGIGITIENQRLIFENYFTTLDTMQYSTGTPYDFNAGGRGFDLLRIKIFSERYHFKVLVTSRRCKFIPTDADICPGSMKDCEHCQTSEDCTQSGSRFTIQFPSAHPSHLNNH